MIVERAQLNYGYGDRVSRRSSVRTAVADAERCNSGAKVPCAAGSGMPEPDRVTGIFSMGRRNSAPCGDSIEEPARVAASQGGRVVLSN